MTERPYDHHAEASFVIDDWVEDVVTEGDAHKVSRTEVAKTYNGDVEGTSRTWLVMGHGREGSAAYCGFEVLDVVVQGWRGTFVLYHNAVAGAEGVTAAWAVLQNSGTGDLEGIEGIAVIVRHDDGTHTFSLDYTLGAGAA